MGNDFDDDDYPILDFEFTEGIDVAESYEEGLDAFLSEPWPTEDDDDDAFVAYPANDGREQEEFYVLEPKDLSCCYEEWEDYC